MRKIAHLFRRWRSVRRPVAPTPGDLFWARSLLHTAEIELFERLCVADQAHSIQTARLMSMMISDGSNASRRQPIAELEELTVLDALRAALLHDIGKVAASSSAEMRALATLISPFVSARRSKRWRERGQPAESGQPAKPTKPGLRAKLGALITYPAIGAELLIEAGSEELVVSWAREHHQKFWDWSVGLPIGVLLSEADRAAA